MPAERTERRGREGGDLTSVLNVSDSEQEHAPRCGKGVTPPVAFRKLARGGREGESERRIVRVVREGGEGF